MSFRTNLRGIRIGVKRNLQRTISSAYKISLSPIRAMQPRLIRNDNFRLSFKQPFAFYLLPFILISAFSFSSCRFNPNLQGKGAVYLQGEWQQDSSLVEKELVTSSQYHVKFDCDSVFIQINYHSKVNYGSDTCRNTGHWAEYIKGAYSQKNDTLFLKGQYCNANFTLKTNTDCFRTGPYQEFFIVSKKADSLIQLSGTSLVIPVNLKLVKKTSCTQKPL